jgi:multidrug efflux pump subunit AcrA (membrane-fusion protein)
MAEHPSAISPSSAEQRKSSLMSSASPPQTVGPTDVADRIRSLQLGSSERKTAEFGLRGLRWLLLLALIAGGIWWLANNEGPRATVLAQLKQWMPGGGTKWEIVPVRVEGGEEVLLDLTGYITPKTKVNVSARIPGQLVALNYEEGQTVEQGAELARLDDTMARADLEQAVAAQLVAESRVLEMKNGALPEELEQARTAVEQARSNLAFVEKQYDRDRKMNPGDLAAAELDRSESAVSEAKASLKTFEQKLKLLEDGPREERIRAAEAEVAQSKALVSKAQTALSNTIITAPISGVILERHGAVGEHLRPEAIGASLFVLADLGQMEVQVDVEEQSLGKLRVGQPCRIIPDAYSERRYSAKVSRWQPQVNRARAVVRVILTIDEPDDFLLAEMNCRAIILSSPASPQPETLWIPAAAVITEADQTYVFVTENGVAQRRPVKLGETKDSQVQIVEGLTKTEQIVLPGPQPPTEGQSVK